MNVVKRQLGRDDVEKVVNACDAGREGELIFAYLYEKAGAKKPVQRLWLQSMTKEGDPHGVRAPDPGRGEGHARGGARSRSEADWIVGMNATRAATIRLRSSFDGAVSLGPGADADAGDPRPPRGGDPRVRARALLAGGRGLRGRRRARLRGPLPRRREAADRHRRGGAGDRRRRAAASDGEITKLDKTQRKERPPLLYDLTSLQREANSALRLLRAAHAGRGPAPVRGAHRAHVSAHELALPAVRHEERDQADRRARRSPPPLRRGGPLRHLARRPAARPRGQRQEGHRPPRDHPHPGRAQARQVERRRQEGLRPGRAAASSPSSTPRPSSRTRASRRPSPSTCSARAARCCSSPAGAASTARRRRALGRRRTTTRAASSTCPRLEQGEKVETRKVESLEKETQPPRRYSDASLLGAMETAGKLVDDEELREAMKDSGIGTPRHARRDHRAPDPGRLHRARRPRAGVHREGPQRDPPARRAPADLAQP